MRKSFAAIVCTSVLALPAFNLGMVIASLPAQAGLYNSMVVFGDSLSDSGNNALVIGTRSEQAHYGNTYVPTFPYAISRVYSNGPVWASDAASMLGVPLTPSGPLGTGGTNFAFGGATTGPLRSPLSVQPAHPGQPISLLDRQHGLAQCALCYRGWRQRRAKRARHNSRVPRRRLSGSHRRGHRRLVRSQHRHDCSDELQTGWGPAHYCLGHPQSRSHAGSTAAGASALADTLASSYERSSHVQFG